MTPYGEFFLQREISHQKISRQTALCFEFLCALRHTPTPITHTRVPVYFPLGIGDIPDYPPTRPSIPVSYPTTHPPDYFARVHNPVSNAPAPVARQKKSSLDERLLELEYNIYKKYHRFLNFN